MEIIKLNFSFVITFSSWIKQHKTGSSKRGRNVIDSWKGKIKMASSSQKEGFRQNRIILDVAGGQLFKSPKKVRLIRVVLFAQFLL
jgi:hypothetical protein